ncbi:MAG: dihydroneopterin aldolase [Balneolaceae bacterium]|nr:dihydroneopterin aldolase [Balneolaceae bacterium]
MDKITLKSLQLQGKHGYYDKERRQGNQFELDVTAYGNFKASIPESNLEKTFDYNLVREIAEKIMSGPSEKLIEALCNRIGQEIFNRSSEIKKLRVSLRKMNPPIGASAEYAEVTMTWNR